MKKGFVITIDALMAVTIASMIFTVILTTIPQGTISNFDKKQSFNLGNDILILMDSMKTLSGYVGQSSNFVNEDMGYYVNLLPQTFCGNLTLEIYDGSVGPPVSFSLDTTYNNYTLDCTKNGDFITVRRMFAKQENQKFGIAKFELWLR